MSLNTKGFAITGILYSILILFLMILISLLSVLTARINRLDDLTAQINDVVENNEEKIINSINNSTPDNDRNINNPFQANQYFITNYRGKYEFKINDNSNYCYIYLPSNAMISIIDNKLKYKLPTLDEEGNYVIDTSTFNDLKDVEKIINCSNNSINKITLTKVYTSNTN